MGFYLPVSPPPFQADLITDLGDQGYIVFGLILFVWELLPTTLLVGFFRVHRPAQDTVSGTFGEDQSQISVSRPKPWQLCASQLAFRVKGREALLSSGLDGEAKLLQFH